jgi:hypothetical protein
MLCTRVEDLISVKILMVSLFLLLDNADELLRGYMAKPKHDYSLVIDYTRADNSAFVSDSGISFVHLWALEYSRNALFSVCLGIAGFD